MKEMRVMTVCGAGVGTSTLLRMNVADVFKSLNLPYSVHVENTSLSRARGTRCDLIITFESFKYEAEKCGVPVIYIKNLMDKSEIREKVKDFAENWDKD